MQTRVVVALSLLLAACDGGTPGTATDVGDAGDASRDSDVSHDGDVAEDASSTDAGSDGGTSDASPEAEGGQDASIDAALDAAPDAMLDAAPDAMVDATLDAGDAGSDADAAVVDPCAAAADGTSCGTDLTCCSAHCTNVAQDPRNCGACGTDCSSTGFCAQASSFSCEPVSFHSVCANGALLQIKDGYSADDTAGEGLTAALAAHCSLTSSSKSVTDSSVVRQTEPHELLAGAGTTVVLAGGPGIHSAQGYLEASASPPVYFTASATFGNLVRRDTQAVVASSIDGWLCPDEPDSDHFVLQIFPDPKRAALVVSGYGFCSQGTKAVATFFEKELAPNLASVTKRWWIVRWEDANGDHAPDVGDNFVVLASDP